MFTCNREILGVHANPLAFRSDSNDANADVRDDDGDVDDADASNADVRDGVNDGPPLRFDDANDDDDAERLRRHFAHALRQQRQNRHRLRRKRPLHDDPGQRPRERLQNHRCDDPWSSGEGYRLNFLYLKITIYFFIYFFCTFSLFFRKSI